MTKRIICKIKESCLKNSNQYQSSLRRKPKATKVVKDPKGFKEVTKLRIKHDIFHKFNLMMNFITHPVCTCHDKNHVWIYNLKWNKNMILMMMLLGWKNSWVMTIISREKERESIWSSSKNKQAQADLMIQVMLRVSRRKW